MLKGAECLTCLTRKFHTQIGISLSNPGLLAVYVPKLPSWKDNNR